MTRTSLTAHPVTALPAQPSPAPTALTGVQAPPWASCLTCQVPAPSDPPPISWSLGVERGQRTWLCEPCQRDHLRQIEGKLDPRWW